jgi:hypothetical protein
MIIHVIIIILVLQFSQKKINISKSNVLSIEYMQIDKMISKSHNPLKVVSKGKTNTNVIPKKNHLINVSNENQDFFHLSDKSYSSKSQFHKLDGNISTNESDGVHAHSWYSNLNTENVLKSGPFVKQLGTQIQSELHYIPDLIEREITGVVLVDVETNQNGVLQKMNLIPNDASPELQGLVLTQIKNALSKPLRILAPTPFFKISLKINFNIIHLRYNQTTLSSPLNSMETFRS